MIVCERRTGHPRPRWARPPSQVCVRLRGPGRFYYRGVGLRNDLSVEIEDPVQTRAGFVAANNGCSRTP